MKGVLLTVGQPGSRIQLGEQVEEVEGKIKRGKRQELKASERAQGGTDSLGTMEDSEASMDGEETWGDVSVELMFYVKEY